MYIGTIHGYCLELLKSEIVEFLKYDVLNEIQQNSPHRSKFEKKRTH